MILVNSNPATIMTDPEFADATYVEPITPEFVEKVIAAERPDALLATLGGQTALNTAMSLAAAGVLEKYDVELIGASIEAIDRGENRESFKKIVEELGGEVARSGDLPHHRRLPRPRSRTLGYPMVVRPSFTMGGTGSGMAYDEDDLRRIAGAGLAASPTTEVLLEESILGWKEYELEVMRDQADNVVIVCSIENLDPMGVHTGDSITVAPAMTLTDREYQHLRDLSIGIIRSVGVDTGGCNIQFAVNPEDGRVVVIEMNPRVSRSSALASKATGFPIAKIAAKVAIGYTLDEIPNDITAETPASFEPTLDYVVVKVPRFAFEKFPSADPTLTTHMKSVGEAMAIGRNFTEALQKALRSLENKARRSTSTRRSATTSTVCSSCTHTPARRSAPEGHAGDPGRCVARPGLRRDPDRPVVRRPAVPDPRGRRARSPRPRSSTRATLRLAKRHGFSDAQVAAIRGLREDVVRGIRWALGIRPVFKTVDTCAAEFAAATPYHYSSYDEETEVGAAREAGRDHPRQRPEPDRAGHRVRLLLRARQPGAVRGRLRDRDGQLQPRDGVDRLRHQRPALLRAAHARGRARGLPRRAAGRADRRRHLPARRADPARSRAGARGRRRADRRHQSRGHQPRRGARRLRAGARRGRARRAEARHRHVVRRGPGDRGRDRLPGPGAPVVRPRRPRHADRLRRRRAALLHRGGHRDQPGPAGARRPVHRRRGRDRRRRAVRRRPTCSSAA